MNDFLGVAAGLVGILGYIPYIKDILRGTTRPDRIAWLIWLLEYTALLFAQIFEGATHSLWLIGLQLLGVVIVFILSLQRGLGNFNRQTWLLLTTIVATLVLWWSTKSGALAILVLLGVEAIGVAITAKKAYRHPGSETLTMWICIGIGGLLGVLAVGAYASPILYVYPLALILMSGSVIIASQLGERSAKATGVSTATN